jgi:hypothetical protein
VEAAMHDGMSDMGGMMWGMGIGHLLVAAVVLLAIAALIKYVFFR